MGRNKKTFLSLLLAFIMMFACVPVTAFAGETVAKIGDKEYETLEQAINEADSDKVIEVTASEVTLPETISASNITIEGQGKDKTKLITTENGITVLGENATLSKVYVDGTAANAAYYKGAVSLTGDGALLTDSEIYGGGVGTWGASVYINLKNGETATIKNTKISGGFRAIFLGSQSGSAVIDNCELEATYPISVDGGGDFALTVKNSSLRGWLSYSAIKSAKFIDCTFGEGCGYAFTRPYSSPVYTRCEFEEGFKVGCGNEGLTYTFNDCTVAGKKLTGANLSELMDSEANSVRIILDGEPYVYDSEAEKWKLNAVAKIGDEYFETLQGAIDAANNGNEIKLLGDAVVDKDTITEYGGVIEISKDITIDGSGYTVTAGDVPESGKFHLFNITDGANVKFENITIDGDNKVTRHGINVFESTVTLTDVTVKNCGGYGVVVNASTVSAENLNTSGNGWGGVNVDKKDGESAEFTMNLGEISEVNSVYVENSGSEVVLNGGTFNGSVATTDSGSTITVNGGKFIKTFTLLETTYTAEEVKTLLETYVTGEKLEIKEAGSYFTVDKKADVVVDNVEIKTETADTAVQVPEGETIHDESIAAAGTVEETGTNTAISDAATEVAVAESSTAAEKLADEIEVNEDDTVTVFAQTYMSVVPGEYSVVTSEEDGETVTTVTLTMDITPMVKVVASTASIADDIELEDGESKNAVVLSENELRITEEVEVSVTLPAAFATHAPEEDGEKVVYVQHKGKYEYTATMTGNVATFTTNGFSPFTFSVESNAKAAVNGTSYLELQDAIDEANDGDTIYLSDKANGASATVRNTKKVTLAKGESVGDVIVTINGKDYAVSGESVEFSYVEDDDSTPVYGTSDATDEDNFENGKVEANYKYPSAGVLVTLTVTPDKGYELESLTITDANGKEIEVIDNGDGTYSYRQPNSEVTIEAEFAEIGESKPETKPETDTEKAKAEIVLTIGNPNAIVNGETVTNDVAPVIRNGRTMLPIRIIADALGAKVEWNDELKKVTITKGDTVIEIFIGSPFALVNGNVVELDSPAFIENDRTYLPVRFVADYLGADVEWIDETKTVIITEK